MCERQRRMFTDEFKREAVGLISSSGRSIRQVADDRWKREQRNVEAATTPNPDMTKDLARLRKENELLKQERDLLKKAAAFFAKETSR